jgi:hypothetical protein
LNHFCHFVIGFSGGVKNGTILYNLGVNKVSSKLELKKPFVLHILWVFYLDSVSVRSDVALTT